MGSAAKPMKIISLPAEVLNADTPVWVYLMSRFKWMDDALAHLVTDTFLFGRTESGMNYWDNRLFIPIFKGDELVSYSSRSMTCWMTGDVSIPKYLSGPNGGPAGVFYDPLAVRTNSRLVIVEGPLDCVPFINTSHRPIAVLGSGMHQAQIENLPSQAYELGVVLMLDRDKLGDTIKLANRLRGLNIRVWLATHLMEEGVDPGDMRPAALARLIDMAEEVA